MTCCLSSSANNARGSLENNFGKPRVMGLSKKKTKINWKEYKNVIIFVIKVVLTSLVRLILFQ